MWLCVKKYPKQSRIKKGRKVFLDGKEEEQGPGKPLVCRYFVNAVHPHRVLHLSVGIELV
jgi:hypothetical protein